MSTQPPWPGSSGENPEQAANPYPVPYGAPQPQYGVQPQQQPPYAQPYFNGPVGPGGPNGPDIPNGFPPNKPKNKALPWILGGAAFLVLVILIVGVFVLLLLVPGPKSGPVPDVKAATQTSSTLAATFQYPQDWVENNGGNKIIINADGSRPAEHFVALDAVSPDTTQMLVYEASEPPAQDPTKEQIHKAIDQGLQGQLDATAQQRVYFRSTSALGCVADVEYTKAPAIVERDNMYGYSYGYTCKSYSGAIEGIYLVAYDDIGVSHRLTIEAVAGEWSANRTAYESVINSLKPTL